MSSRGNQTVVLYISLSCHPFHVLVQRSRTHQIRFFPIIAFPHALKRRAISKGSKFIIYSMRAFLRVCACSACLLYGGPRRSLLASPSQRIPRHFHSVPHHPHSALRHLHIIIIIIIMIIIKNLSLVLWATQLPFVDPSDFLSCFVLF